MAKKKRPPQNPTDYAAVAAQMGAPGAQTLKGGAFGGRGGGATASRRPSPEPISLSLPSELARGDSVAMVLAMIMFFAPALGVPHEQMLQDTLKSIVVSFGSLVGLLMVFWGQRNRRDAFRWHFVMWLPLMLVAYALGSMVWSHAYLGGVEAIRWFVLAGLVWLGLNCFTRDRFVFLAHGVHWGAFVASLWAALQFWTDFTYFPQGPNPASTFVNRNFFAEFTACTFPFSIYLLLRAKNSSMVALFSATTAFNLVAVLMSGTRSATVAMVLGLLVMVVVAVVYRRQFGFYSWSAGNRIVAAGVFLAVLAGLGSIPTGNPKVAADRGAGFNAFQVAASRSATIGDASEYTQGSFSVRLVMWKATLTMIGKRPLSGVGAGAWEVDIPLYQADGAQLETDYYVHNEYLQLIAEYGVVGWVFLLLLFAYLLNAAWRTLRNRSLEGMNEGLVRAVTLTAILVFLAVSGAGFPWRMASTGALFALCLGVLAASDARLGYRSWLGAKRLPWQPAASQVAAVVTVACIVLAAFITERAAASESKIVQATKYALTISRGGDPQNPKWDKMKREMLQLIKEGTDINPHYRKITPMVADELARWGDWKNAIWVWESVVSSRPYVTAIMSNIARGYMATGNVEQARYWLERCKTIQPNAPSVRSLEIVLLSRSGDNAKALELVKKSVADDRVDFDTVNAGWTIALHLKDYPLAIDMLERRGKGWPDYKPDSYVRIGQLYASAVPNEAKAIEAFKIALESTVNDAGRQAIKAQIPVAYQAKL